MSYQELRYLTSLTFRKIDPRQQCNQSPVICIDNRLNDTLRYFELSRDILACTIDSKKYQLLDNCD